MQLLQESGSLSHQPIDSPAINVDKNVLFQNKMIDLLLVQKTLLVAILGWCCQCAVLLQYCLLPGERCDGGGRVTDDKCEPRCSSLVTLHITSPGPATPPGRQVSYNTDN